MRFLDNVLQDFIDRAPPGMEKARATGDARAVCRAWRHGVPPFLQALNVPWESVVAKVWNKRIFKHIRAQADTASIVLAEERGACPDAEEYGSKERFSHKMSLAPTASISIIAGNASCIDDRERSCAKDSLPGSSRNRICKSWRKAM